MARTIERIFEDKMFVDGSIISYGQSFICTKNISVISVRRDKDSDMWILGLIVYLVGSCLGFIGRVLGEIPFIPESAKILAIYGIALCAFGIFIMALVLYLNNKRGYHLQLEMNSGTSLCFARCKCDHLEFLEDVMRCLTNCVNGNVEPTIINFESCKFEKSQIGNGMTVTNQMGSRR